ncbi:MAG: SpoIID/LytB domain-containing protein [Lachnospiraceae bacterium]|nr:SpoIID/LytB domain-containing protein [Lachnospiraceae bacterium]
MVIQYLDRWNGTQETHGLQWYDVEKRGVNLQKPGRRQVTRTKRKNKTKSRNHTRIKWMQIMLLSLLVLVILVADAYRKGKVTLYQEKPAATKEKKSVSQTKTTKETTSSAVQPDQNIDSQKTRILISTTGFTGYYHDLVTVQGTKELTVSQGKKTRTYPAGEKVAFRMEQKYSGKIGIEAAEGGRIQICSITRQNRQPKYRGKMELKQTEQGFILINELSLQEYLYAVVPSELSTGHKMEALKAQAVCARTYAYHQIQSDRYKAYSADLDDSTASQVYNNIPEDKRSRKAVKSTSGEVVARNGDPVITYYYSTSWGKSASGKEVWNTPSEVSHLQSCMQTEGKESGSDRDLSTDAAFRKFLSQNTVATYDQDAEWYRWHVAISSADLEQRLDAALQSCYQTDSSMILTQNQEGEYRKRPLRSLGKLRKIRIESRGKSGLVTALVLVGSENVVKVCGQYNIRKVLSPGSARIHYGGGETTMAILPSAAFYMDCTVDSDGKTVYEIYGGGCGHGTGMSQCGASRMAEQGKAYRDILQYYFSGCEVSSKSIIK